MTRMTIVFLNIRIFMMIDNKWTCCQGGGLLEAAEGGKRVEQLGEGLQLAEQEAWLQLYN